MEILYTWMLILCLSLFGMVFFEQLRLQPVSFGWGNGLFVWSEGGRELHRERVVADDIECRKII